MQVECFGGPHDGAKINVALREKYVWTNGRRCYRSRRTGMVLYRREKDTLVFAGHDTAMCKGCGTFHARKGERCTFCGGVLI